jgi:formylglycine-generating enzyme required for sulfatase activity
MAHRDPLSVDGETVADKYEVGQLVGEGGFACVYRARHKIWNKPVAIKFFSGLSSAPMDQREALHRAFIQEGALLTELSSHTASIVQARDVGTYTTPDGQWMPFMVLEWLDGLALDELLERERAAGLPGWTLEEVLGLLGQAATALEVAHRMGIAHRDIKPPNLFVLGAAPRATKATLKILDFGVAKMMTDSTEIKAALAKTGMSVTSFTPQYGAPEQFDRSHGATGPWSDVFALALVAVEMLAGHPALDGENLIQLAFSAKNPDRRPTPRTLGLIMPDDIEAVFQRALAVDPKDRYATAGEFWREVERVAGAMRGSATLMMAPGEGPQAPRTDPVGATLLDNPRRAVPGLPGNGRPQTGAPAASAVTTSTLSAAEPSGSRRGGKVIIALVAIAAAGAAAIFLGRGAQRTAPPPAAPVAAAAAAAAPKVAALDAACPTDLAKIPAGQYYMGSEDKDAPDNEKPSHNVKLNTFCVDLFEVTAAKYKSCSDQGKCRRANLGNDWPGIREKDKKTYDSLCTFNNPDKTDHPINCVTWEMADTFCRAHEKRLPTEAEWEYATRGPDGRVYPWGDDPPSAEHLNACGTECVKWGKQNAADLKALYEADDGYPTTAPVGKFPKGRSRFGPYDVVGNVFEWVADWYGPYTPEMKQNPMGPSQGDERVLRGGSWNGAYKQWLRPSFRFKWAPSVRTHGIGFRCARSLQPG